MFVVVNFDALAHASDIRIERRQVVFLCWMQDSNPGSQTHIYIYLLLGMRDFDWVEGSCNDCNPALGVLGSWVQAAIRTGCNYYTSHTTKLLVGLYWFHSGRLSGRPSVRPASRVCSVAPIFLVGFTSYLCILSSNFKRCAVYRVSCKFSKFEFLAIF